MFKYPIALKDAMRCLMAEVPAAQVIFHDPVVQAFYVDRDQGLCKITCKRFIYGFEEQHVHEIHITYYDPELEMIKRLQI
jgi:hypothetical protein